MTFQTLGKNVKSHAPDFVAGPAVVWRTSMIPDKTSGGTRPEVIQVWRDHLPWFALALCGHACAYAGRKCCACLTTRRYRVCWLCHPLVVEPT